MNIPFQTSPQEVVEGYIIDLQLNIKAIKEVIEKQRAAGFHPKVMVASLGQVVSELIRESLPTPSSRESVVNAFCETLKTCVTKL